VFPDPPNQYTLNATASLQAILGRGRKPDDGSIGSISSSSSGGGGGDDGDSGGGPWVYYSGELDRFGEWAYSDIEPFGELLTPMPSRSSVNLWMGSRGVTAHCHCELHLSLALNVVLLQHC
jgi:hypothetical protein